uniref:MFS domain-containing protein n=1 Tax=Gongylonema pulchrum TaxID=637853 RepID=A0A183EU59_9BILA
LVEWTTSAFMLGNMVGASTLTRLSDKIGRRPILISSLLILGITGSLSALASGIISLTLGRFVQGICSPVCALMNFSDKSDCKWMFFIQEKKCIHKTLLRTLHHKTLLQINRKFFLPGIF